MNPIKSFFVMAAASGLFAVPQMASAQTEVKSTSAIFPVLLYLKSISPSLPEPLEIDGDFIINPVALNGPSLLAARELHMRPGSRLLLAGPMSSLGNSREAVVIAFPKIVVLPAKAEVSSKKPPVITWIAPSDIPAPPRAGKASSGRPGEVPGANGAEGGAGMPGNPGFSGLSAPHIYLATNEVVGGTVQVDLKGKIGGRGGDGQDGGDGGAGATGAPSSSGVLDCRSGPGQGGNGGRGGKGGDGGRGGKGGDGGALFLIVPRSGMAAVSGSLVFLGEGGDGGEGGAPGSAGAPGNGGGEGRIGGFCGSANRAGKAGPIQTERGANGTTGPVGASGSYYLFPTDTLF